MALSINRYVSIQSYNGATASGQASVMNCLLLTPDTMSQTEDPSLAVIRESYEGGEIVTLTQSQASALFATTTNTSKFADGYYGYVSPSKTKPTDLMFFKIKEDGLYDAFRRANSKPVVWTALSFITPDSSDESTAGDGWEDDVQSISAAIGNRIFVVNYKANPSDSEDAGKAVDFATSIQSNTPVIMVYGANPWSGYMPMAAIGSTVFSAGISSSLMYRQFGDDVAVADDTTAELLDSNFINYLGMTQSNGRQLKFFQRGYNLDGTDTTVYLNEMWFRNNCEAAFINRLSGGTPIPHSDAGAAIVKNIVRSYCDEAVTNGIFLPTTPSDEEIAIIQSLAAPGGFDLSPDEITYSLSVNGYRTEAYPSTHDGEPSIAYWVAYGSGASIKFIEGFDYVVQ